MARRRSAGKGAALARIDPLQIYSTEKVVHRGNRENRALAIAEAVTTVLIWGATFVATKIALQEVSPATIVWLRFGMGLLVLGTAAGLRRELAMPGIRDWAYLALLGLNGVAFHQWLQSNGLQTAQATTTAWIVATTPIFIAALGWVTLGERFSRWQAFGMCIAALGVILLVSNGKPGALLHRGGISIGDLLVSISAVNWAVYTILSRRGLAKIPPARMIFFVMLAGYAFITIWAMGFGPGTTEIASLTARGWTAIIGLGVLGSGVAYILYYDALRVLPASQLGAFLYIEPLVTTLLAVPLLGEPITPSILLGGGLIIAGIYLVNRRMPDVAPAPRPGISDSG